ncbi:MAG: DinB family protein [Candidatus Sulfotelmatobacter sp.]
MNRRKAFGSIVAGAAATAATVSVMKAADTEIEIFVGHWKKSKALTLKGAEAMPAEFYDFKPFPEARAFGAEQQHLGQAEGFYLGRLGKGMAPTAPRGDITKDATVKYLTELFDWSIGVVGQLTSADLTKTFGQGKQAAAGLELLYQAMIHTAHTRGYGEMYLRIKGVMPPTYDV